MESGCKSAFLSQTNPVNQTSNEADRSSPFAVRELHVQSNLGTARNQIEQERNTVRVAELAKKLNDAMLTEEREKVKRRLGIASARGAADAKFGNQRCCSQKQRDTPQSGV
jgi:hypothetical protein